MNLAPMAAGSAYDHCGVSHTLKHFLAPTEVWEDITNESTPEASRPRAAATRLGIHESHCALEGNERTELLAYLWTELLPIFKDGYRRTVTTLAADVPDPHTAPERWRLQRGDRWIGHIGAGVVMVVSPLRERWHVHTAYRPADFRLRDYSCPPTDAASVSLRKRLAVAFAKMHMATRQEF